tara:strand:+ start:976 stop:1164 length:189 start_codon:yes stop_codon:yes gene_type:complete
MAIQKNNYNSINFINHLMSEMNSLTDEIYESLMDEDYLTLQLSVKKLQEILKETQKISEDEL